MAPTLLRRVKFGDRQPQFRSLPYTHNKKNTGRPKMISKLFGRRSTPISVNLHELRQSLGLDHERYVSDPNAHVPILAALGEYTLRGSSHYGPAHSYYQNPSRTVTIKAQEPQFSDMPMPEDEHIRSAASIAFTEETRGFGKRTFALIIRQDAETLKDMEESLAFGLYGLYDKEGNMVIRKIIAPGKDEYNHVTDVKEIPLTEENVNAALRYAAECARVIHSGERFYPRACLDRTENAKPAPEPRL